MAAPRLPFKSLPCSYLIKSEFNICVTLRCPFQMDTHPGWADQSEYSRPARARARGGSGLLQCSLEHSRGHSQAEKHFQVTKSLLLYTNLGPSSPTPCVRCPGPAVQPVNMPHSLAHPPRNKQFGANSVPAATVNTSAGVTEPAKTPPCPDLGFYRPGEPLAQQLGLQAEWAVPCTHTLTPPYTQQRATTEKPTSEASSRAASPVGQHERRTRRQLMGQRRDR